ncbi:ABC transporter permease subunit [Rossellomorea vietnamensis]|uniref:ABC transporter permease subunit n=1 Tax=Rossellomorea vietnamensis TaxID=218284 RepID=A0A5D4MC38_9BACI|nr:ABC transporter permease subunit [Rossellomorea vietnamensis]TYR98530.1 ABC transporter permease subunit [Rossellomorea vietnamensis]
MLIWRLIKNPYFLLGFLFLFGLFGSSLVYYFYTGDHVPVIDLLKDKDGKFLPPPYSPLEFPPLGTDNFGHNVFILMLVGAKYTIGAAMAIAFLRVIPSVLIGLIIHFLFKKIKPILAGIVDASNYFPTTLLAFLLLNWVMSDGPLRNPDDFLYSFQELVVIYILILVAISIPSVSLLFSNEIESVMKKEFIDGARVLGAREFHFIKNHLRPFIVPQIYLVLIREFIATMLLISHLGVLGIFIGGSRVAEDLFGNNSFFSLAHEWSGSLGTWWQFLWTTYPWIAFIPVVFFTLTILAGKMMLVGLSKELEKSSISHDAGLVEEKQKQSRADQGLFEMVESRKM